MNIQDLLSTDSASLLSRGNAMLFDQAKNLGVPHDVAAQHVTQYQNEIDKAMKKFLLATSRAAELFDFRLRQEVERIKEGESCGDSD